MSLAIKRLWSCAKWFYSKWIGLQVARYRIKNSSSRVSYFDGLPLIPQRPDYNFKVHPSSGWITSGTDQRTKHIPKTEIAEPGLKVLAAIQELHQKKKPENCAKPSDNHRIWEGIQLTSFSICLSSLQLSPSRSPGLFFSITISKLFIALYSVLPVPCANDRNYLTFMGM